MLQLFRTNSPLAAILVAIYVVLLNLHGFLLPHDWEPQSVGVLSEWVFAFINKSSIWAQSISLSIILIQALMVNALVNHFKISKKTTYFPAVFYVFSISLLKDTIDLSPILMGMTFYIIALFQLFSNYKARGAVGAIFNMGFWVAVGSMFYMSIGVYLILGIVGLSMLISLQFRETLVLFLGFLTPYFLFATYFMWVDSLPEFWYYNIINNFGLPAFDVFHDWRIWPKLIFLGLVIILSFLNISNLLAKTKIQIQKYIWLLFWAIPIATLSVLFQAGLQSEHLIIVCVSISVFLSLHFLNIKNKAVAEFLHLFLLMLYFGFQYWEGIVGLIGG